MLSVFGGGRCCARWTVVDTAGHWEIEVTENRWAGECGVCRGRSADRVEYCTVSVKLEV